MTLFAGDADEDFWKKGRPFFAINTFRLLEDDPAMGSSNGRWLVGDESGLKEVARDGGHAPFRSLLYGRIRNLAVRPRGSFATNPYHVIFTLSCDSAYDHAVYALAPDGSHHIVAGGGFSTGLEYKDGQGRHARFGIISALEMAPDGTIYVADRGNGLSAGSTPRAMSPPSLARRDHSTAPTSIGMARRPRPCSGNWAAWFWIPFTEIFMSPMGAAFA